MAQQETYDPVKLEKLKFYLFDQAEKGHARFFEIYVDGIRAVPRTNDYNDFDNYETYFDSNTEKVRVLIYSTSPTSPRHDKHEFTVKKKENLNGLNADSIFDEKIKIERERWDAKLRDEKLAEALQKIKDAEAHIDKLTDLLYEKEVSPNHLGRFDLGKFAGSAIDGILRKNPRVIEKIPGLEGIAEAYLEKGTEQINPTIQNDSLVSFKKKAEQTNAELNQHELECLHFGKSVAELFDDEDMVTLVSVVKELGKDNSKLATVADLLNIKKT